ncbi:hypothetical protein BH09SUM1_BH09SUM1_21180 [soil metagenome]
MNLGVQYYRAPFPQEKYWKADFERIKACGMNTVQLWVLWSWVESKPGQFNFDDYDRLVDLAKQMELGVVLSTIAEVQPHWIHREVPGSEMIDHMGHKVVSSQRLECHFGLTPGGCTDNPGVWERMAIFLAETTKRYSTAENLVGWDAWNELRWNVHSDGYVCYCDPTLVAFRRWLEKKYKTLDGLNEAWVRRYNSWEEVMPGKSPVRPFTEMMAFQHFLTWRANQHGLDRVRLMKSIDPKHVITVHPAAPCPLDPGGMTSVAPHQREYTQAINRGNDWFFADEMDGIGCSSFPKWGNSDDTDFTVRMRYMTSAARGKKMWLSELQSAASVTENQIHAPVAPREQQRWLWQGIAAGADTVLFWCWRDEVFGREAGAFGMAGNDGYARQRMDAMAVTSEIIKKNEGLLANYKPDGGRVGVFFSPQSYYLNWSQEGNADFAMASLQNYCRALARNQIPYIVIEEEHLEEIDKIEVLFMPRTLVLDWKAEKKIEEFVNRGGTLLCESECGAWDSRGFWRYPEDRMTTRLTGVKEVGRRPLPAKITAAGIGGHMMQLGLSQWITPLGVGRGKVLAPHRDYDGLTSLLTEVQAGKGRVFLAGSFLGNGVNNASPQAFEDLICTVVRSVGIQAPVEILHREALGDTVVQITTGRIGRHRAIFLFAPEGCPPLRLNFDRGFFPSPKLTNLMTGKEIPILDKGTACDVELDTDHWGVTVLVG